MTIEGIAYKILGVLFFIVAVALYGGLNYYIGIRIWKGLFSHIPYINSKVFWVIYWIIVLAYVVAALMRNYPNKIASSLEFMGGIWLGLMFYIFIALLVIDLIRFIISRTGNQQLLNIMSGSKFQLTFSIIMAVFLISFLVYSMRAAENSKVSIYNLNTEKTVKGSNIKIIMVSDIHIGGIIGRDRIETMVKEINDLKPDLILIAGDIIDSSIESFKSQNIGDVFRRLQAKYGVYAAMGNHDGFDGDIDKITMEYNKAGVKVLRDEIELIDNCFYIGGRVDASIARGKGRKSISDIVQGADMSKPIIIMDHQPIEFQEEQKAGVDLLVSGHTHRGQLSPANLITSRIFELDYGYLKRGNLNIVVSSGYGTWGPPMRIGSQSEIVEINLRQGSI